MKHCQHFRKYFPAGKIPKQGEKSLRQKKTECPSRLTLRVYSKRPTVVQKLPLSDHLCEVDLTYDHDHPIDSAHALSFRDVHEKKQSTNVEQPIVISTSDNKENEPIVDEYSVDPGTSTCTRHTRTRMYVRTYKFAIGCNYGESIRFV